MVPHVGAAVYMLEPYNVISLEDATSQNFIGACRLSFLEKRVA